MYQLYLLNLLDLPKHNFVGELNFYYSRFDLISLNYLANEGSKLILLAYSYIFPIFLSIMCL